MESFQCSFVSFVLIVLMYSAFVPYTRGAFSNSWAPMRCSRLNQLYIKDYNVVWVIEKKRQFAGFG